MAGDGEGSAEAEEWLVAQRVLAAFGQYGEWAAWAQADAERDWRLAERPLAAAVRTDVEAHFAGVREAIAQNQRVLLRVRDFAAEGAAAAAAAAEVSGARVLCDDMDKLRSTLRQMTREWSAEGAGEREAAYAPLLRMLERRCPAPARVLVPGCGLGRLPWEVARRGYVALGCEFSFFMLFASNFVLNGGLRPDELTVQPYVHARSNVWRAANTLRAVRLPDVDVAAGLGAGSQLAIAAGDLLEVLDGQEPASWDAVLTCFFVDTARNIFDYVEALRRALRPNGWWFNLGPLTYHWAHDRDVPALELSYEQLRLVVRAAGFDIVEEDEQLAYYCDDPSAMMRTHYRCAVFAARLRAADAL